MELKNILSATGTCLSLVNCIAPLPGVIARGKTGKLDLVHKEYLYLNHSAQISSLLFSLAILDVGLITVNCMTVLLTFCTLLVYNFYTKALGWVLPRYLLGILVIVGIAERALRVEHLAFCSLILSVSTLFAPCKVLKQVVKQRNHIYIDPLMTLCNLCKCSIWASYTYLTGVPSVLIPNLLGFALNLGQVILYIWAKNTQLKGKQIIV